LDWRAGSRKPNANKAFRRARGSTAAWGINGDQLRERRGFDCFEVFRGRGSTLRDFCCRRRGEKSRRVVKTLGMTKN